MSSTFKTTFPITMLDTLGRHWHAEYFVGQVIKGTVGSQTTGIRMSAEAAVRAALSLDY